MTKKHLILPLIAFVLLASNARAGEIKKEFQFENPEIVKAAGGVLLEIKGCRDIAESGEPILPVYPARFLIPRGEKIVNLTVEVDEGIKLVDGVNIPPMPYQFPLNAVDPSAWKRQTDRSKVYNLSTPYPSTCGKLQTVQSISGLKVGFVNLYPCQYIPSTGTVIFHQSITVTIETETSVDEEPVFSYIPAAAFRKLERVVENPEELESVRPFVDEEKKGFALRQENIVPYVIITSDDLAEAFDSLAQLKRLQGLNADVIELSWIQSNFPGFDIQESIRNFIIYAYENWHTRYVLLGGDDEVIPNRPLYAKVGTEIEPDICSDLYYGALDGDWNADGDAYYGEPGEEDLLPEVIVGRLPVDSPEEAMNATAKIISYSLNPVSSQCKSYLSLGELLWTIDGENTWGADYKDEVLNGSSNYGLETQGIPSDYATYTLYDRDMSFSWNKAQLLPIINSGVHLINHLGHANQFYVMRLSNADVPLITSDGIASTYFILYSQGCFAASFDNRDNYGTYYEDDCIAEELICSPYGAVAFVGNTRLGWDAPGSTCGASQFFDRQFFDAIFGEGLNVLGDALEDSRFDNIPYITYPAIRYIYYEMTVLGDPAMPIWTEAPRNIIATYDSVIINGQNTYEIEARDETGPIKGANATLFSSSQEVISYALTDEWGKAVFDIDGDISGDMVLSIFAPNHFPVSDTIAYIDTIAPQPTILFLSFDDDSTGTSCGDGDRIPEPSERISIDLILRNAGSIPLDDSEVIISSTDQYISIVDSCYHVSSFPAGSWLIIDDKLSFEISPYTPNAHCSTIRLEIVSSVGKWAFPQSILISAASPTLEEISFSDDLNGNGNGCIDPWEFIDLNLTVRNEGSLSILSPTISIEFPDSSWGRAVKSSVSLEELLPGESYSTSDGELEFFVREKTPEFSWITFFLKISSENIPVRIETLTVQTCGYALDEQAADPSASVLTHHSITGCDQWHISSSDYRSPPYSWKFGDTAQASYYNMSDAVLTTPPICLSGNSTLKFWHRMEAEASDVYPYWAEDVGVVEISTDFGRTWNIIDPIYLYPCKASGSNTIFIDPYRRCYSGTIEWKEEQFDLSSYSGPVMLRFRFASNEQIAYEGWYIDDITVTTEHTTDVGDNGPTGADRMYALGAAYPNPFNPATVIPFEIASPGKVTIRIYDISGREITTLMDGTLPEGKHRVLWNGRDNRGRSVASGVYFLKMRCGVFEASERLILIR